MSTLLKYDKLGNSIGTFSLLPLKGCISKYFNSTVYLYYWKAAVLNFLTCYIQEDNVPQDFSQNFLQLGNKQYLNNYDTLQQVIGNIEKK